MQNTILIPFKRDKILKKFILLIFSSFYKSPVRGRACYFIALFLTSILFLLSSAAAADARISLDDNTWYINEGFSREWLDPEFDPREEPGWIKHEGVPVRPVDFKDEITQKKATYTYITRFTSQKKPADRASVSGLFLPSIGEAWQIYLNGNLIEDQYYVDWKGNITNNRFVRGWKTGFSSSFLQKENRLVLRITGDPRYWATGLHYSPGYIIDDYDSILKEKSELLIFMLITLYLLFGFYHLLLFIRRSQEKYNLYFGLFSIGVFLYLFSRTDKVFEFFGHSDIIMRFEYIVLYTMFPLFIAFIEHFLRGRVSRITKGYTVFCGALIITTIFSSLYVASEYILLVWQISAFPALVYFLYLLVKALRDKHREAPYLVAGSIVVTATVVFDILDAIFFQTGVALSKYGLFIFVTGIALILANRFVNLYNEVEDLNINLEQKVRHRTEELKLSLDEVNELKYRQDGDYYLTSLLVKPLGGNDVSSRDFTVKDFARQYKQFSFKHHETELGGDLNIATNIKLQGRSYIAFVNCDAMGKSMQGAGGAMVAGVIYNSFLNRTRMIEPYRMRYPERWLKECLSDLENVFLTFDGSMMISLVMGLVDEETGFMYYLNAEHPRMVLYRNRRAVFIEDESSMYKLGVDLFRTPLRINTFHMIPGDTVIAGSDGRDDIVLGVDEEGNRIINEDENLFLQHVEDGEGDLGRIAEIIASAGSVSDDLTMMSISFTPAHPEKFKRVTAGSPDTAEEISSIINSSRKYVKEDKVNEALSVLRSGTEKTGPCAEIFKEIVKLFIREKRYAAAANAAEQYSYACPEDTELLYMTSYASKFSGNFEKGIDFGERIRLRDPGNAGNLMNLSELYCLAGNTDKAERILKEGADAGGSPDVADALQRKISRLREKQYEETMGL